MSKLRRRLGRATPATYRIRLEGLLDETWTDYMSGMTINHAQTSDGLLVTTLEGRLVDQAALFGLLNNVYDLGFSLLSVEILDWEQAQRPD